MSSIFHKSTMMLGRLRESLRRRFSPSRLLRRRDGLARIDEGGAGAEWIVARELTAYTVLDASSIPAKRRNGYAATQLARWAPFADPQFHTEWVGGRAMVWAWSRGKVLDDEAVAGSTPPRRLLPESIYRGQPRAEGCELVAMDHGVEGRVWRDFLLATSQWWPQPPSLREWNLFRRSAGLPAENALPEVVAPVEGEAVFVAWTAPKVLGLGEVVGRYRTVAIAAAAGIVTAALALPLFAGAKLLVSNWNLEREIAAQDRGLQEILAAREAAMGDAVAVDALLALRPPAGQVELLAALPGLARGPGLQLMEWRMPEPDRIDVVLQMARPDPRALVEQWEASGRFRAVTVELGRDAKEVNIKAEVVRQPLPAAPAEAAQ